MKTRLLVRVSVCLLDSPVAAPGCECPHDDVLSRSIIELPLSVSGCSLLRSDDFVLLSLYRDSRFDPDSI